MVSTSTGSLPTRRPAPARLAQAAGVLALPRTGAAPFRSWHGMPPRATGLCHPRRGGGEPVVVSSGRWAHRVEHLLHDVFALADDGDTAVGDGEAAGAVVILVHTDLDALADHDVLVEDGVPDHRAAADLRVVQDHRPPHPRRSVPPHAGGEDRLPHTRARHDHAVGHDAVDRAADAVAV